MKTVIYDYIVEWDDAKNESNYQKHGIHLRCYPGSEWSIKKGKSGLTKKS